MAVMKKIFILGLPGSGKSTIARYVSTYVRDRGSKTNHFNDYWILHDMFLADSKHEQFQSTEHGGFDIVDLTAFDRAIQKLEHKITIESSDVMPNEIILIEFARNDYQKAFQQFSTSFLQDAYFLYLAVDLETCKGRIRERVEYPTTLDDHFVSEYIFGAYYKEDDGYFIPQILEKEYGIDRRRVEIIHNPGSLQEASPMIHSFLDFIIANEPDQIDPAKLPDALASIT